MAARPVAVVTGASAGAGRSTARALAERRLDVALLARGEAGLAGAAGPADEVRASGGRALQVGFTGLSFLRSLPRTAKTFVTAAAGTAAEKSRQDLGADGLRRPAGAEGAGR